MRHFRSLRNWGWRWRQTQGERGDDVTDRRGSGSTKLVLSAVLFAACAAAGDFEVPPAEPAAASLPAELVSGPHFTVREPVKADGLMHHYELQSRYGDYAAYGQDALKVRAHEIEALAEMSRNNDVNVVVKAAVRQVQNQTDTVKQLATHPVKTVPGIPRGIAHLF